MVHDRLLDAAHVGQFKTLILPNIAALSDEQCRQLRAFVERGGGLVATYETSLYDEWGARRKDFGLADLFGVSFRSTAEGRCGTPTSGSRTIPARASGIRSSTASKTRRASSTARSGWSVTPRRDFPHPPLTLIPSYPDLPMEKVYPARRRRPTIAEVYLREIGAGRVVYFPWDIDRVFWEVLAVDHGLLLAQRRPVGDERGAAGARSTGPGVLDVTVWRQKASMTVHLVNLTNPMMMKGPFRELIPVGEQQVVVRLPEGARARRVQLLREGRELPVQQDEQQTDAESTLDPRLRVIAIDLE